MHFNNLPSAALRLGLLGLVPFITLPIAIAFQWLSFSLGAHFFLQYSAIILSFLGGVHWLNALQERHLPSQIYIAMLPSIVAWLSLVLFPLEIQITVLTASHAFLYLYDRKALLLPEVWVVDYIKLRGLLTAVVACCHLLLLLVK